MTVAKNLSEADALRQLLTELKAAKGVTQADFAKRNKIPGGASMISQHLSENRPINLEQAISYAAGFQREGIPCSVSTISRRLFQEIVKAAELEGKALMPFSGTGKSSTAAFLAREPENYKVRPMETGASRTNEDLWPFASVTLEEVERLSSDQRATIEVLIKQLLPKSSQKHTKPEKKPRAA